MLWHYKSGSKLCAKPTCLLFSAQPKISVHCTDEFFQEFIDEIDQQTAMIHFLKVKIVKLWMLIRYM